MAQKPGNGGHGLEEYDPETGRYIKEGDTQYHAGTHFGVEQISEMITSGYYGQDIADLFNNGDDEEKSALIGYLQTKLDGFFTKQKLENEKNFKTISQAEFTAFGDICEKNTSVADRNYFYHNYVGAGQRAFEFNKALRLNDTSYLAKVGMSLTEFENQTAAFDRLANSFEVPQDMQTFRYDRPGVLTSWFGKSGVFDDIPMVDDGYGYLMPDMNKTNIRDLERRMQSLIGSRVKRDGAFSSFSCVEKSSHMVKNADRFVKIKYNIPKGKKCFISKYDYESEGMFPRDTAFVIQDVKIENENGVERLVLYYGVE